MSTSTPHIRSVSIDLSNDLASTSDLLKLLQAESGTIFRLASTIAMHVDEPISGLAGTTPVALSLSSPASWTTAGGIGFSLKPEAKCAITIADKGTAFEVAMDVDSATATDIQAVADGSTYVNIDLDFDISGNVSGLGTVAGLGISGKASGSLVATLTFCQPVPSGTPAMEAIIQAFSEIVLPTAPDSVSRMVPGSACRMNFDGTLKLDLNLSYGLADYKFSAPGAALVRQSITAATTQKLTLPSGEIKAGATASVKYVHADHFGLIVNKPDAGSADLYLVRSSSEETKESVGVTAGITFDPPSVALDSSQLASVVQKISGSAALGQAASAGLAKPSNALESAVNDKLKAWTSPANGEAGLSVALAQKSDRTNLFSFRVDLNQADLAVQSWNSLLRGDLAEAMSLGGFTLLPGSGVVRHFSKSCAIQFHFFNLFKWTDTQSYFENSSVKLGPDGSIRFFSDFGREDDTAAKQALDKIRFHFSATATSAPDGTFSGQEIDLNIELSASNDAKGAAVLAQVASRIHNDSLPPVIDQMARYVAANPTGTLNLIAVLKPSAYGQLGYSPHNKSDKGLDEMNWIQIHAATVAMTDYAFARPWQYRNWCTFNSYCNTGTPDAPPDRRNPGNTVALPGAAVPSSFYGAFLGEWRSVVSFFVAAAAGMNLCEDLVALSQDQANATTEADWNRVLDSTKAIVRNDVNIDYGRPVGAALLSLATAGAAAVSVQTLEATDSSAFTSTITISAAG